MNQRIPKLILKYEDIKNQPHRLWNFTPTECYSCKGHLFYASQEFGVVFESYEGNYSVLGNILEGGSLRLSCVGVSLYCAECGCHYEGYYSWQYGNDDTIHIFSDGIDPDEMGEVEHALNILNRTGSLDNLPYPSYTVNGAKENILKWLEKNKKLVKVKSKKVKININLMKKKK